MADKSLLRAFGEKIYPNTLDDINCSYSFFQKILILETCWNFPSIHPHALQFYSKLWFIATYHYT